MLLALYGGVEEDLRGCAHALDAPAAWVEVSDCAIARVEVAAVPIATLTADDVAAVAVDVAALEVVAIVATDGPAASVTIGHEEC